MQIDSQIIARHAAWDLIIGEWDGLGNDFNHKDT